MSYKQYRGKEGFGGGRGGDGRERGGARDNPCLPSMSRLGEFVSLVSLPRTFALSPFLPPQDISPALESAGKKGKQLAAAKRYKQISAADDDKKDFRKCIGTSRAETQSRQKWGIIDEGIGAFVCANEAGGIARGWGELVHKPRRERSGLTGRGGGRGRKGERTHAQTTPQPGGRCYRRQL